jgi:predicted Zn-dependent protease
LSLRHLKRSIELEPRDALSRFNYARILVAAGKRTEALQEMRAAERYARKQPALSRKIRDEYRRLKYPPRK